MLPTLLTFTCLMNYACRKPIAFDYREVKNIRIENWNFSKPKVAMDLVFYNRNNFGVNLKNVNCELYLDSSYLGNFALDTTMHIPKSSEFVIPATLYVDMKGLVSSSLNLIFKREFYIKAKGTSKVGKGGFYVTIPFNYEGRQKLNLF